MKKTFIFIVLCISCYSNAQIFLNLNFEYEIHNTEIPVKWSIANLGYKVQLDSIEQFSLRKSLKIESDNPLKENFGAVTSNFPIDIVKEKTVEFRGRVKTRAIVNGYAGLFCRVDGNNKVLSFDNMAGRGLSGTNDWQLVSIKMKIDSEATNISFGALLTGKGTAWFDNFEIDIDGQALIETEPKEPTEIEIDWLKSQIYPLQSFDPKATSDDLKILKELIGGVSVVALGESTHGSSEIFKMKHRLIKYLAENENFDIFSIEANMPESYKLNEYIINNKGNPKDLIKGMYFWTWDTYEVLDLVNWMKEYNKSAKKMKFTGFDMQFYYGVIDELNEYFKDNDNALSSISELIKNLDKVNEGYQKTKKIVITHREVKKINNLLSSIKELIDTSQFLESDKVWLYQNVRIIEQYITKSFLSRDKYMAENLLWIKSQNPESKIITWAHNGHIKESKSSMGKYLSDNLKENYLSIGFAFHKGTYTAVGKDGLTTYPAQNSYMGTYEYIFNALNEPIFLLDLRNLNKENSKWLYSNLDFRTVGAVKRTNEFSSSNIKEDYDLIIFINESTNSKLLD